jgi:uncharacterized HhH-GPD family protein
MAINITGDDAADKVLTDDPFALLLGMLLDQQYPMEHAFRGPAKLLDRFGTLDPATIASAEPEAFATLCAVTPAVHRFPGSMATKIQAVARDVVEIYGADASRIWTEADLHRPGRQAARREAGGLGGRGGGLQPRRIPVGCRRGRPRLVAEGARVQEGKEGRREGLSDVRPVCLRTRV